MHLGIHIPFSNLSEASLIDVIYCIGEGSYQANVERLRKSFVAAGGVQKVADLIEFYKAVEYCHLIPAYARYNWSSGCSTIHCGCLGSCDCGTCFCSFTSLLPVYSIM